MIMRRVAVLSACMVILLAVYMSSFARADNSFAVKSGDYVQWKETAVNRPNESIMPIPPSTSHVRFPTLVALKAVS